MKILFAVQGTGNGHVSRAREVLPFLKQHGEVSLLISGTQVDVGNDMPVKHRHHGLGFVFGSHGGVDMAKTLRQLRPWTFIKDLRKLPLHQFDVIINDFEPLTAYAAKAQGRKIYGLSHQSAFSSMLVPRPAYKQDFLAEWLFRHYAPFEEATAFHFKKYDYFIETPVIRQEVRQLQPGAGEHVTVYLPAYADDFLIRHLSKLPQVRWELFSKHSQIAFQYKNIWVRPINNQSYLGSLENSLGLVTGGGFEAPAEAFFLGKKVFMVPMSNQFEQHCNVVAAMAYGAEMCLQIDNSFILKLRNWLSSSGQVKIEYPNHTQQLIAAALQKASKW
ncbi:MAG: glycosyltransferase family protein [Sphingobacteriaceae bacterium]|nr:glycosyltransferase family protein [Sphingobacteriaceae bacterium]